MLTKKEEENFRLEINHFLAELVTEEIRKPQMFQAVYVIVLEVPDKKPSAYGIFLGSDQFLPLTGVYTVYEKRGGAWGDWSKFMEFDFAPALGGEGDDRLVHCTEYNPSHVPLTS